ncbi:MAG: MerR family transcriptional regulator [Sandaracinaceae bacterium]|nr:MerR family transcriptional regulator [Sandaracinaceae bacterium]MBK8408389.1 MerR family transcriptional regulator [Sandaracinaceae bacterium]
MPHSRSAPVYPMRVVSRRTGLSADLIRAWEKRYQAITPDRTDGNARRYSHAEIQRLELLRDVVALGHTISDVAALPNETLAALLSEEAPSAQDTATEETLAAYVAAIEAWDLRESQSILSRAASLRPPDALALEVLSPILRAVGDGWEQGRLSVTQEHAASAQVRGLLATLLQTIAVDRGAPKLLVAAPEGHEHELGGLMAAVLGAQVGVAPVYLGGNVPLHELESTLQRTGAEVVLLAVSRAIDGAEVTRLRAAVEVLTRHASVWVGCPPGHALEALAELARVRVLTSLPAFQTAALHLARRP